MAKDYEWVWQVIERVGTSEGNQSEAAVLGE